MNLQKKEQRIFNHNYQINKHNNLKSLFIVGFKETQKILENGYLLRMVGNHSKEQMTHSNNMFQITKN